MLLDEARALGGAVVGVLQAALPFERRPAVIAVTRKTAENAAKVDVTIAEAAKPSRPIEPVGIAAIDAAARTFDELGILDVKRRDAVMVTIDEAKIVEVLQAEMARIVLQFCTGMLVYGFEEALEGGAVMKVLAGMQLEAQVDVGLVGGIEQRTPEPRKPGKGPLEQTRWRRRIGIEIRPGKAAGEHRKPLDRKPLRQRNRAPQVLLGAGLARRPVAAHLRRRQHIGKLVIGRMHREQLAHALRGQLADDEPVIGQKRLDLAQIIGLFGAGEIENASIMDRNLQ